MIKLVKIKLIRFGLIASLLLSQPLFADDTTASADEQNAAVIAAVYQGFQKGDGDSVLALMSDDVEWIHPGHEAIPFGGSYKGKQGVEKFFANAFEHLEVLDQQVFDFLVKGEMVAALGFEKMRVKSTGKEYQSNWVHLYTLCNGKIVRFEEFIDTAAVAAGFVP